MRSSFIAITGMSNSKFSYSSKPAQTLSVAGWTVDASTLRISKDGKTTKLARRTMAVLTYLASRPGETVSREELEREVWHGQVVVYEALSNTIAKLRKAFEDNSHQRTIIETIPKVGYRLIGEVRGSLTDTPVPASEATLSERARDSNRWPIWAGAVVLAGAVTAVTLLWPGFWQSRDEPAISQTVTTAPGGKPSLAVLPFTNMSGDPEQEYFADGMTDDLITDLSKISGLLVIARNSTFKYKGKSPDVTQVSYELGVQYVLEGSVRRAGDHVRINAQLVDATSGRHIWAERYDGTLEDVFAVQDEITQKIVVALAVSLTADEKAQQKRAETENPEAYDAFLEGLERLNVWTPDDIAKSIPFFETAIELDPDYARAHAHLATAYVALVQNEWEWTLGISYDEGWEKGEQHLQEAMKNPTPRAHRLAARMLTQHKRWDEALAEAERGIALNPNDHNGYAAMARILIKSGRYAEGLEFANKAQRLDPLGDYLYRIGSAQYHMGSYEEAVATMLRATKRRDDEWNYIYLAAAYGQLGREKEAKSAIEKFEEARAKKGKDPYTLANIDKWRFKHRADRERLREGLRKGGMPPGD